MAMQSKFRSTCPLCSGKIKVGDMIDNKNKLSKWAHQTCPVVQDKNKKTASVSSALSNINTLVEVGVTDEANKSFELPKDFIPSIHQEKIFDFIINGKGHAVVEAVAGSGKTTTIVKALEYIPLSLLIELGSIPGPQSYKDLSVLEDYSNPELIAQYLSKYRVAFLAYNKHIAKELKKRAPGYVHVSTIHSLAYSVVVKKFPGIELDEDKLGFKMDDFWPVNKMIEGPDGSPVENSPQMRSLNRIRRNSMRKLVSIIKSTLIDYTDLTEVERVINFYNIEIPEDLLSDILDNLRKVMNRCKDTRTMDYDDMIWLPIIHNIQLEKFHYLLVDEFQDLNNCQMQYILRSVDKDGRIIGVGDRMQSLYGFRGADVEAIPRMIKELNATVLPLSISYRCPAEHIKLAQTLVPSIMASENAKQGEVIQILYDKFLLEIEVGDMVVCRTNAPLVKPAFEAIRKGKKAIIRGKDIGRELVNFIEKFEATSLGHLEILIAEFTAVEYQRLLDRGKELQADMAVDKQDTIKSVADECKTVSELISKLKILFDDSNEGIVFSSIHRAKGLEAERVFILRPDLMPHPKAKQSWEHSQEQNAQYVAYTRSKDKLFFVQGEF